MNHTFLFFAIILVGLFSIQRYKPTNTEAAQYIQNYKKLAQDIEFKYGIPTSIVLAQAILESRSGQGALSRPFSESNKGKHSHLDVKGANNHFCIKGETERGFVLCCDDACNEKFRLYSSVQESYLDYGKYLSQNKRYKPCFECKFDLTCWSRQLQKCGYATDPQYADKILRVIEENNL